MPKAPQPPNRPHGWRANPYESWRSPSRTMTSSVTSTSENRPLPPQRPVSLRRFELPSGSFVNPFEVPSQLPSASPKPCNVGEPPRGKDGPPRRFFEDSLKATEQAKDKPKRDLTMVDSMLLQSVSRCNCSGSGRIPGLSIHSNSRGGGVQFNVFTKVPTLSKTIAFNVKSEEALLAAYRHVKAMNPSAPVGGVMFSVAPKNDGPVEVANVPWRNFDGRDGPRTVTVNSYPPSHYRRHFRP